MYSGCTPFGCAAQGRGRHLDDAGRYEVKMMMSGEAFDASMASGEIPEEAYFVEVGKGREEQSTSRRRPSE